MIALEFIIAVEYISSCIVKKVELSGFDLKKKKPSECLRYGVVYSLQGNRVFHHLTVTENIVLADIHCYAVSYFKRSNAVLEGFQCLQNLRAQKAVLLSGRVTANVGTGPCADGRSKIASSI